jgi:hypothetical protein
MHAHYFPLSLFTPFPRTHFHRRYTPSQQVTPSSDWGGEGLLGLQVRFDAVDAPGAPEEGDDDAWALHVVEVEEGSPAALAGLRALDDWILGAHDTSFADISALTDYVSEFSGASIILYVYRSSTDAVFTRLINLPEGGGLGVSVANGRLHTLPNRDSDGLCEDGGRVDDGLVTRDLREFLGEEVGGGGGGLNQSQAGDLNSSRGVGERGGVGGQPLPSGLSSPLHHSYQNQQQQQNQQQYNYQEQQQQQQQQYHPQYQQQHQQPPQMLYPPQQQQQQPWGGNGGGSGVGSYQQPPPLSQPPIQQQQVQHSLAPPPPIRIPSTGPPPNLPSLPPSDTSLRRAGSDGSIGGGLHYDYSTPSNLDNSYTQPSPHAQGQWTPQMQQQGAPALMSPMSVLPKLPSSPMPAYPQRPMAAYQN